MIKICKNTKNYKLTLNKQYEIEEVDGNYVKIINDNGKLVRYDASLFEDEVVIPPPPPIRTETQIIQSIVVTNNGNTFTARYNNRINELVSFNVAIHRTGIANSCGVEAISGLNDIISVIEFIVDTEHEDYLGLKKALFLCIIDKIKNVSRNSDNKGAIIFSTNINENHEDYYTWLSSISMTTTEWFNNPNSGNNIKIWCVNTA